MPGKRLRRPTCKSAFYANMNDASKKTRNDTLQNSLKNGKTVSGVAKKTAKTGN